MTDPVDRIERRAVSSLTPYAKNARMHSPEQIALIAASMREHGQTQLIIADEGGEIIAGHGRVMAAAQLGLETVAVGIAVDWSPKQKRAYRLKDNQLALSSTWDDQLLTAEVRELQADEYDLSQLGFGASDLAAALSGEVPAKRADASPQLAGLSYSIVVRCKDEAHQSELLEKLEKEGETCEALIS